MPDIATLDRLRAGVELSDGGQRWRTRPALVDPLAEPPDLPERTPPIRFRLNVPTAWIALTITEGRNRQVRRMTAAVGHPTLRLGALVNRRDHAGGTGTGRRAATDAKLRSTALEKQRFQTRVETAD